MTENTEETIGRSLTNQNISVIRHIEISATALIT
jgi:hypothetical protein